MTVDASGNLYIADSYNHRIRKVDHLNLSVTGGTQSASCNRSSCTIRLNFKVTNSSLSTIDTTDLSALAYLSSDASCDTADASLGSLSITSSPAEMSAGASTQWAFSVVGKSINFKNKYACVLIDGYNTLNEYDEMDNWVSWPIKL